MATKPKKKHAEVHANWREAVAEATGAARTNCVTLNLAARTVQYTAQIKKHRDITVITGDEEVVRAHLISRLVNELGYRIEVLELERPYEAGRPKTIFFGISTTWRDRTHSFRIWAGIQFHSLICVFRQTHG